MTEKKTYILDGKAFWTLKGFAEHFSDVVLVDHRWHGRSFDAFNDIMLGGFGTPEEGFIIRWKHSRLAKPKLGPHVFNLLVKIMRNHGPGGSEGEDGVELIVE